MLTAVVDRTDGEGADRVRRAFEAVEVRLATSDLRVAWPVTAEIVPIPIMGATKSLPGRHTLYVSTGAVRSRMLDGLLAHEMGHMIRTEQGHPSHDPAVFKRMGRTLRVPPAGETAFGQAFNHVQDIYADDIAFLADLQSRAYGFFADWVRRNARSRDGTPWQDVALCVSNGFALGNLARHALLAPDDALWGEARSFDAIADLRAVDAFAEFFRTLPPTPTTDDFLDRVRDLAGTMQRVHGGRGRGQGAQAAGPNSM